MVSEDLRGRTPAAFDRVLDAGLRKWAPQAVVGEIYNSQYLTDMCEELTGKRIGRKTVAEWLRCTRGTLPAEDGVFWLEALPKRNAAQIQEARLWKLGSEDEAPVPALRCTSKRTDGRRCRQRVKDAHSGRRYDVCSWHFDEGADLEASVARQAARENQYDQKLAYIKARY